MEDPPLQPIVAAQGSKTHSIAKFLDWKLKQVWGKESYLIKDSWEFLRGVTNELYRPNLTFLTIDVVDLFSVIPTDVGLEWLEEALWECAGIRGNDVNMIMTLVELVLQNNYICYGGEYFKQTTGVSMGANFAPTYADIIMAVWEKKFVHNSGFEKYWIHYSRFLDDICIFWVGPPETIQEFITYIRGTTSFLNFTYETSEESVHYLDVTIRKETVGFTSTVYRKPTFSNSYLHFSSSHPEFQKRGIIKGQFVRASRMTSQENQFNNECDKLTTMFMDRGYPETMINSVKEEVFKGRTTRFKPILGQESSVIEQENDKESKIHVYLLRESYLQRLECAEDGPEWKKTEICQELGDHLSSLKGIPCLGQHCWHSYDDFQNLSLTVPGLTTGKKYIFHVKSVSPAGLSKPSQDSEPIIVNAAIAPPSAPYCFVLLYCGKNEMIVGWRAPQFRGGAAILGYFLDQLNISEGEWHSFNDKPLPKTVCKVGNLKEGQFYRFRACAVNLAGVGKMSSPSDEFICEEWTMAQPGPPFDVRYTEVRSTSLMLHWDPPFYTGKSAVTGYFVEVCEMGKEEWKPVNKNAVCGTHLKIPNLETGKGYSFRVRAVNSAGVGEPSAPSDPVLAETRPGTKEIEVDVDEDGFIFFSFETPDLSDSSEFIWSKDYEDLADSDRVKMESDGNRSKLILTNPSEQDLGTYSVEVTETDGISSSHTLTPEELEKLLARSHEIRNPLIKLISGWNIDILEKGEVRLWLQVEPLSPDAQIKLIFNETPMSSTPTRQIKYDKPKGLVEIIITDFSRKDEGSYTAQIQDGKPKNQFTLVLIDDKFKDVLDRSDFQRKEWKRKQGPHFLEYLKWTVTEECEILFTCKITNTRKDTQFKWFKDGKELKDGQCDFQTGACSLLLKEFTKNTEGVYKATVSDARGEDVSELNLTGKGLEDLIREICRVSALTAGPLKIQSTAEGIKLYSVLKCYVDDLKTTWFHKEKKLDSSQRIKIGSSPTQVWMHIGNPTEADKGKYTLELFDGKEKHKRTLDLSGQAFADAMAEYQRLKQAAFAEKNRARIEQGLPDVATIMEDKTLILTCSVSGDPAPEVSWLKNEKPLPVERCEVSIKGKIVTLTIKQVTGEDSGMYELLVKNKHGSESVKVTVSVYKHGEEPLEAHKLALGQSGKAL
ncbi:myomesin-3-like [Protopterus annectens]|uniref:myomesin-3-like n=1 Tax=Protopterus annectens TaxID=7888 RepID=UPI001CFC41EA|nr:myomesin-3-like [Protopterus annectens]